MSSSPYLSRRQPGEPPYTLLDFFPDDFLTIIDESHMTIPQVGGMYHGDRSRKLTLVEHGFRLPSALDNRPLNFREFEGRVNQIIHVSATPGPYELKKAGKRVAEQIIRPTGLTDPEVEIRPAKGQVDDLLGEIVKRAERDERTLVTTLTKKMAEGQTRHYHELGLRIRYLHSEADTLARVNILRDLRKGEFDTLIGINLLREGLDLPEVSAVVFHRQRREKKSFASLLDGIPGLGEKRKKALLAAFRSVEAIKAAQIEELAKVVGFKAANALRNKLQA